jgi:hypothetical protein
MCPTPGNLLSLIDNFNSNGILIVTNVDIFIVRWQLQSDDRQPFTLPSNQVCTPGRYSIPLLTRLCSNSLAINLPCLLFVYYLQPLLQGLRDVGVILSTGARSSIPWNYTPIALQVGKLTCYGFELLAVDSLKRDSYFVCEGCDQGGHQPIQSNLGSLDWISESSGVVELDWLAIGGRWIALVGRIAKDWSWWCI